MRTEMEKLEDRLWRRHKSDWPYGLLLESVDPQERGMWVRMERDLERHRMELFRMIDRLSVRMKWTMVRLGESVKATQDRRLKGTPKYQYHKKRIGKWKAQLRDMEGRLKYLEANLRHFMEDNKTT